MHPAPNTPIFHLNDARSLTQKITGSDIFDAQYQDPESEHSEQSSDDISKQDKGDGSDMEDTDNAHIPKVSTTTWFKPIPESERPATPEPEWTIPPNDFPEPEHNWANAYASTRTGKREAQAKLNLEGPAFNLAKAFHKNSVFLQYQMDECHKLLTNKVDWSNPEGHQIQRNIYEPLPLGGPPGQWRSKASLTGGLRRKNTISTNTVSPIREAVRSWSPGRIFSVYRLLLQEDYTIVPRARAVVYRDRNNQRKADVGLNELHKAWRPGEWSEDDKRRRQRLHHAIEKRPTTERSIKSGKLCLRGKNKRFDYRDQQHNVTTSSLQSKSILNLTNIEVNVSTIKKEILLDANIKQALGVTVRILQESNLSSTGKNNGYRKDGDGDGNSQPHKGVKASANSDVKYSFTSAQDGEPLQDDGDPP
ncbi:hypothetical protein Tco_0086627 [Tanacetum coccineum]